MRTTMKGIRNMNRDYKLGRYTFDMLGGIRGSVMSPMVWLPDSW